MRRLFRGAQRSAWIVFGGSLLLVLLAMQLLYQQVRGDNEQKFKLHVEDVRDAIQERLRQHEQILLGAAGLFAAGGQVTREAWRGYVTRLQLERNYPGIQGVGYSQLLQPGELQAHIQAVRREGYAQYTVHPPGERDLYTAIVYLEPFRDRNLAAFGYDMFSQTTRNAAMRRAGESGETAITGKVRLVQETHGREQAGFLMYVPIYRRNMPLGTEKERWRALQGFVYSPYRVDDLMRGVMGESVTPLSFAIYDGDTENEPALMHDSRAVNGIQTTSPAKVGQYKVSQQIDAYGRQWRVRFESRPEIETSWWSRQSMLLMTAGLGFSAMLWLFVALINARREQAEALASEMTTEIRRSERQLKANEARLNEAQRTASIGNWELDLESGDLHWSDEIFRLFEIDKNAFPATYAAFLDVIHPEDREAVSLAYAKSLEDRQPYEIKHRLLMRDGRIKWVHERCSTEFHAQGRALISRGTVQDITQLALAERQSQENAEFAQSILNNALDGIISINEKGEIQSFNKAAERIFGYMAEEVMGKNVKMLMPDPYRTEHDGYLHNYHRTGVPKIIGKGREVSGMRRDGSVFPMDLAVSSSQRHGRPLFVGLVRDITERKRVEQMKVEFVSTVSHELRTPLTSISGALSLVCSGRLGEMPEQTRGMLEIAHKNSQRLTHLINDLLDMERLVAGKMRFDMQGQELMPLVEQSVENMRVYAQQYRVTLEIKERADGVRVRVDSIRLQQVLSNLLSNAAKFSPSGDAVILRVRQTGRNVRVEVEDCGPGIPEEFGKRIFQKFSQADSSDARKAGGTGLGLAISKELIERMNGMIGFDSNPGQGACFHFELPVEQDRRSVLEFHGAENPGAARVLVVEDDPDIAELLVRLFAGAGYGTDAVGSVEAALQLLESGDYQLVTLDLMLPDRSGVSLLATLRARPEFERLPVIVVSAFVEDGKLAINGEFAVQGWLDKPIDEVRLMSVVRQCLPHRQGRRARILHVEDDGDFAEVVSVAARADADYELAHSLTQARVMLERSHYDLVILDLGLPEGNGFELLPQIEAMQPTPAVLVLSARELLAKERSLRYETLVKSRTSSESLLTSIRATLRESGFITDDENVKDKA